MKKSEGTSKTGRESSRRICSLRSPAGFHRLSGDVAGKASERLSDWIEKSRGRDVAGWSSERRIRGPRWSTSMGAVPVISDLARKYCGLPEKSAVPDAAPRSPGFSVYNSVHYRLRLRPVRAVLTDSILFPGICGPCRGKV